MDLVATNTRGTVALQDRATYRPPGTNSAEPPWTRGRYQQLDYLLARHRWANAVGKTRVDRRTGVESDHWPVFSEVRVRFRRRGPKVEKQARRAYSEASIDDARRYNVELARGLAPIWGTGRDGEDRRVPTSRSPADWAAAMKAAADRTLPKEQPRARREYIRPRTWEMIKARQLMWDEGVDRPGDQYKKLEKDIKRAVRGDKREHLRQAIDEALTARKQWQAIRQLKQGYQPRTYGRRDRHGRTVALPAQAEATADYLEQEHWADGEGRGDQEPGRVRVEVEQVDWGPDIVEAREGEYDVGPPTMEELGAALANLKNNKAAGPDGCEAEVYKLLDEHNREALLGMIRHIWETEEWDESCSCARVVSIYKKGDPTQQKHNRPISLLNTLHKLLAAILKNR